MHIVWISNRFHIVHAACPFQKLKSAPCSTLLDSFVDLLGELPRVDSNHSV
nr:MAG TPA: hypothetical protein [Caudoviricetes sp.]